MDGWMDDINIITFIIITIIVIGVNKVTIVNRSRDRVIELQKEFPGTFFWF
jgi:shikimate 5-dehydrogenase